LPDKETVSLEAKNPSRAASDTFTARQTVAVLHRLSQPGMSTYIDPDWAGVRTNPALHAPGWFGNDTSLHQYLSPGRFLLCAPNYFIDKPQSIILLPIRMAIQAATSSVTDIFLFVLLLKFSAAMAA